MSRTGLSGARSRTDSSGTAGSDSSASASAPRQLSQVFDGRDQAGATQQLGGVTQHTMLRIGDPRPVGGPRGVGNQLHARTNLNQ